MPTSKADLEEKGSLKESQIKLFPFSYEQLVEQMSIQGVDLKQFPIVSSFGRKCATWNGGVCEIPYLELKEFQRVQGMIDNRHFIAYSLPDNTQVTLIETPEKGQLPVVIKISKTPEELVAQQLSLDEIAKELIYATRSKEEVIFYPKALIEAPPSVQYLPSKIPFPQSTSVLEMRSVFPAIFLNDGRDLMRLPFLRLKRGIRAEGMFHGEKREYYSSLQLQDYDVYDLIRGVDRDNRHFISFKSDEDGKKYIHTYFELEPCTPEFSNWKTMKVDVTKTFDCVWGISLQDINDGDLKALSNRMNPKLRDARSMRASLY